MSQADFMDAASEHVIEHARMSKAQHPAEKPYFVRWPLSSGQVIFAADTYELVKLVARKMSKRANA